MPSRKFKKYTVKIQKEMEILTEKKKNMKPKRRVRKGYGEYKTRKGKMCWVAKQRR